MITMKVLLTFKIDISRIFKADHHSSNTSNIPDYTPLHARWSCNPAPLEDSSTDDSTGIPGE